MANTVCLTSNQQKFYNYLLKFHKENGHFPNSSRAGRDLNKSAVTINGLYGVLFQKGAFTNGQSLIDGIAARHNTTKVQALNISEIKVSVKPRVRAHLNRSSNQKVAQALINLLTNGGNNNEIVTQLLSQLSA